MGDTLSCVEPSNPQFKDAPQSDADSRPPSVNSADVVESVDGSASPVDLNAASEAQLTTIKGIGTKTAANIVAYRTANGPFETVDDLAKVKGVSAAFVDRLRPSLTVGGGGEGAGGTGDGGGGPPAVIAPDGLCYPTCPCLRPDFPAPIPRPQVESFSGVVRGRPAVRVASWNLQCCSAEKMDNNGVREVVCLTLLEQGIKLLAVQELADKVALQKLCAELNTPSLRSVRDWPRPRGDWRCVVSENPTGPMYQSMEYAGFAWDASSGLELLSEGLVRKKKGSKHFARYPYLGYFKAGRFDFTLVNVHLKATGLGNAELEKLQLEIMKLPQLLDLLEEHLSGEKDTLLLGDFNLTPDASDFDALRSQGFKNCVPADVFTNISIKNLSGSKSFDNVWLSPAAQGLYTGGWSVVRQGLSHRLIPDGWTWGGVASDHCPVWAEFHSDRDHDSEPENVDVRGISMLGREI
ncbi:endonuclease/exonuclease/phosphatase family domain-containing protein 1-like [Lethenteron reissneri]|uniref:endonuclease/exonuclease/phosphatase family domain-containing protein 1-like n=1 Tax=Lethenteron reissneri TaxID=7753 RepID=UPI002AB66CC4|nr:endonuclease/exonuclease/phosphatase family domain-containing protein 1-like [Lethenteron reissneri]XP_061404771.1 endonuclease/exonuclease/phosphatase family domain-containing protein 1-like [Lethenteron reissneri]